MSEWITNTLPDVGRTVQIRFRDDQWRLGIRGGVDTFHERFGYRPPCLGLPREFWSLVDAHGNSMKQIVALDQALGWRPVD